MWPPPPSLPPHHSKRWLRGERGQNDDADNEASELGGRKGGRPREERGEERERAGYRDIVCMGLGGTVGME